MTVLYDDDMVLWSERQAVLLRSRATGDFVNDAELDWPNIAEMTGPREETTACLVENSAQMSVDLNSTVDQVLGPWMPGGTA